MRSGSASWEEVACFILRSGEGEDIRTCTRNADLLAPMLQRMAESTKLGHPPIDGLRLQVEGLFQLCKRVPLPDFDQLQKWAWRLRFLVCFIKMKARRKEVSVETWKHVKPACGAPRFFQVL